MNLNIWTYNINSIRSKIDVVNDLLRKYNIDILFLTETKITRHHEAEVERQIDKNYKVIWNSNQEKYYHGTAVIYSNLVQIELLQNYLPAVKMLRLNVQNTKHSKIMCTVSNDQLNHDINKAHKTEGRIMVMKCTLKNNETNAHSFQNFILVGTYVPNSGINRGDPLKRLAYRTKYWDLDLYHLLMNLEKEYKNVIWLGDLNVARFDNDMGTTALKRSNFAGVTPEERNNFKQFMEQNKWIDTWHHLNPDKKDIDERCTFGVDSFCRLRIDYILCSPSLLPNMKTSQIKQNFEGSDHVPMGTLFTF